jgi:tetratricopeptide (TPR) repeat protein
LESLRTDLLQAARPFYEKLVELQPDNLDDKEQRGKAFGQLGILLEQVGSRQDAIGALGQAAGEFRALADARPSDAIYRELLGEVQINLSSAFIALGRFEEAQAPCDEAVRVYAELDRVHPESPAYQKGLAVALDNQGIILMSIGRPGAAEEAYTRVLELRQKLLDGAPLDQRLRLELAGAHTNRGELFRMSGRLDRTEADFREALKIWQAIGADRSSDEVQMYLARGYHNLGILLEETDREADAATDLAQALEIQGRLVRDHGSVTAYQDELAGTCTHLGDLYLKMDRVREAIPLLERARSLRARLTSAHPYDAAQHGKFAMVCVRLASQYEQANRAADAEAALQEATRAQEKLAALLARRESGDATIPRLLEDQANVYETMAGLAASLGQGERLLDASGHALDLRRRIVKDRAGTQDRDRLAGALLNLSNYDQDAGNFDRVEPRFKEAIAIWESLERESGGRGPYTAHLADAHSNLGNLYRLTYRLDDAEPQYREALELRRKIAGEHPTDAAALAAVIDSLVRSGHLHAAQLDVKKAEGEWSEALKRTEELFRLRPGSPKARDFLVDAATGLGDLLLDLGRKDEAAAVYERGLAAFDGVPAAGMGVGYERVMFLLGRGNLELAGGLSSATSTYRDAVSILEPLSRQAPRNDNYAIYLGALYCNLGHAASHTVKDPSKDRAGEKEALDYYKKAIDTLEAARRRAPRNAKAREFLANAYRGRMGLHLLFKRRVEAIRDLSRAKPLERGTYVVLLPELAKKLVNEIEPFEAARLCAFFATFFRDAPGLANPERARQAENFADFARKLLVGLAQTGVFCDPEKFDLLLSERDFDPLRDHIDFQRTLGIAYVQQAEEHIKAGHRERAEAALVSAVERWDRVIRDPSGAITDKAGLVAALLLMDDFYQLSGRPAKAEAALRRAAAFAEELADKKPTRDFREAAAETVKKVGLLHAGNKRPAEAVETLQRAKDRYAALARDNPGQVGYVVDQVDVLEAIAEIHEAGGRKDRVEACLIEAAQALGRVDRDTPDRVTVRVRLGTVRDTLGSFYLAAGQLDRAQAAYRDAIATRAAVARAHPEQVAAHVNLAGSECNLAHVLARRGKVDEALGGYGRAAGWLEAALKADPASKTAARYLNNTLSARAWHLANRGRDAAALDDWDRLIALNADGLGPRYRVPRAKSLAGVGRYVEAVTAAEAVVSEKDARGADFRQAAEVLVEAARAARDDASLPQPRRVELAERYASRAVEWLREAGRLGLNAAALELDDSHLDPLRSRPDFRALSQESLSRPTELRKAPCPTSGRPPTVEPVPRHTVTPRARTSGGV